MCEIFFTHSSIFGCLGCLCLDCCRKFCSEHRGIGFFLINSFSQYNELIFQVDFYVERICMKVNNNREKCLVLGYWNMFQSYSNSFWLLYLRWRKITLTLTRKVQSIYKIIIVLQILSELRLQSNLFAANLKKDLCSQLKFVHGRKAALPYNWVGRICSSQISEGCVWRYKVLGQVWGCRSKGNLHPFVDSSPQTASRHLQKNWRASWES